MHFKRLPAILPLYLRAAVSRRPRFPLAETTIPKVSASVDVGVPDPARLQRYAALVGHRNTQHLPPAYPQILAAPLHLALFTTPGFPLNPTGVVHMTNHIDLLAPLPVSAPLEIEVSLSEGGHSARGCEMKLLTVARIDGEVVWRANAGLLARYATPAGRGKRVRQRVRAGQLAPIETIDIPASTGRRYARVSGDYNPIHLSDVTARMFGFDGAIAHGMWSLARVLGPMGDLPDPVSIDVEFRRPLFLPAQATIASCPDSGGFALQDSNTGKNYLEGVISPVT